MVKFAGVAAVSATGSSKVTVRRLSMLEPVAASGTGPVTSLIPGRTKTWRMRLE